MNNHKRCLLNHTCTERLLRNGLRHAWVKHAWKAFLVLAFLLGWQAVLHAEKNVPEAVVDSGFIRSWLICGEFPNPSREGHKYYDHQPPCIGLNTDYLAEHGGQSAIQPSVGMAHKRPDGSTAAWFSHTSRNELIDFVDLFSDRSSTENVVAYAYTTVRPEKPGRTYLAVGSDDGVRIWHHGKLVHDHLVGRAVRIDQDLVAMDLSAGDNAILVKVEQGARGWLLVLRLVSVAEAAEIEAARFDELEDDHSLAMTFETPHTATQR